MCNREDAKFKVMASIVCLHLFMMLNCNDFVQYTSFHIFWVHFYKTIDYADSLASCHCVTGYLVILASGNFTFAVCIWKASREFTPTYGLESIISSNQVTL